MAESWKVLVVGCGGTGGYVAEGLCRLLAGSDVPLILIDHDRVEPHNLLRQHFYAADLGKFKAQVLAERLARQFGRPVGYCVYPYDADLVSEEHGIGLVSTLTDGIIVGCVDNVSARRSMASAVQLGTWWLDAGNSHSSGQVLLGNASRPDLLEGAFEEYYQKVSRLPMPSLQLPSLLIPPTLEVDTPADCAVAVAAEQQSPVINHAVAMLVLQFMHQLLNGKLSWMGAYIDLEAGTLQTVPAEPETIARMYGVKVDTLITKGCSIGDRYSLRRR